MRDKPVARRLRLFLALHPLRSLALATSIFLVLSLSLLVLLPSLRRTPPPPSSPAYSPNAYPPTSAVSRFLTAATRYLVGANHRHSGRFTYEVHLETRGDADGAPPPDVFESPRYNVLRHAGAVYALGDACWWGGAEGWGDENRCKGAKGTVVRAAEWMLREVVKKVNHGEGYYGVWSSTRVEDPVAFEERAESVEAVKLGGLGLGLVALVTSERVAPGTVGVGKLRAIGDMIVKVMQKPDGTFFSYYDARHGPSDQHACDYFPGEAALGLVYLYELTHDKQYLRSAVSAVFAFASSHRLTAGQCDHWTLISCSKLVKHSLDPPTDAAWRARVVSHAHRLALGCHDRDVSRTPGHKVQANSYCTGLEGMFAVLPMLAEAAASDDTDGVRADEVRQIWCQARRTVGAVMAAQSVDRKNPAVYGAVSGRALLERKVGKDGNAGGYRRMRATDGVFRVDTTQHCLSAVVSFARTAAERRFEAMECDEVRVVGAPVFVE